MINSHKTNGVLALAKKTSEAWKRLQQATADLDDPGRTKLFVEICEVAESSVSRWRTGENVLSLRSAKKIAQETGYCTEYLMSGKGPKQYGTIDRDELLEAFRNLSPSDKARTLALMNQTFLDYTDTDDNT